VKRRASAGVVRSTTSRKGALVTTPTISTCQACRTIDRADGVEDGKLYRSVVSRIGDERTMLGRVRDAQDRVSDGVTAFAGSVPFVDLHAAWFAAWIALNVGAVGASIVFDRFPFGLLTLVVSLEAIFLSTFILISQNRQAERSEVRSQIDFENNLRAEIWSVHIGQALGIDPEHVEDVISQTIAGYVAEGHLASMEDT
jgi:hypothetical protein